MALCFPSCPFEIIPAWHDEHAFRLERVQVGPIHPVRRVPRRASQELATGQCDQLGYPVAWDVRWIEPLQCQDARPRSIRDPGAHRVDAPLHVGDAILGLLHRSSRAANVANAREDCGEIMRVEAKDRRSDRRCDDLALWYRAHIANTLREYEIWSSAEMASTSISYTPP